MRRAASLVLVLLVALAPISATAGPNTSCRSPRGVVAQPGRPVRPGASGLLTVGSTIASGRRLRPVPRSVVKRLPQYAGYRYFIANGYMVIVHMPARRISYLLPLCRGASAIS